jgi:class 3 adenylate cyclase
LPASLTDAVQASLEIQEALNQRNAAVPQDRRLQFRMGINLGLDIGAIS